MIDPKQLSCAMKNDDCIITICSTPYSKRLPKKCFLPIGDKPALQHILDRIQSANIKTIIAIPTKVSIDDNCYDIKYNQMKGNNLFQYRGYDDSPLHRMRNAIATKLNIKYIIRITHDDILIDVQTMLDLIDEVRRQDAGYGYTPSIIEGAGVEVIHIDNLRYAAEMHRESVEHISYFVKGQGCPNPKIVKMKPRKTIERPYRLTLDYYEDFVLLQTIFNQLGNDCTVDQICEYLDMNGILLRYNKLPETTIYTSVRNGSKWIRQTVNSIFCGAQDREYILIDDYSTDNTLQEVLSTNVSKEIKVMCNTEHKGLASSSNIAIDHARGKYIMRIDTDDLLKLNTISRMKETLDITGAVICYSNYDEIDENNEYVRRNVDAREHHHAGCALMNKRWVNEIRFKEGIHHWDSLELYKRIKDRFPIAYIDEPLWYYRRHDKNLSKTNGREKLKP